MKACAYLAVICWFGMASSPVRAESDPPRWEFEPLAAGAVPEQAGSPWAENAIDGFILARLEEHNLTPQPEADRHTLIRRAAAGI
ncbi:MAG: hypothetical protein GWO24_29065, partial [Akkermansiaceae bacterium]|nr:hypothetical protein [Akkermansiaceae bacterium]